MARRPRSLAAVSTPVRKVESNTSTMATISTPSVRRRRRSRYSVVPSWVTRKRAVVSVIVMFSLLLVAGGIYGVRLSLALAKTFHTNPISAAIGALQGGGGSGIDRQRQHYQRINIVLYGYGGSQHSGAFLTDSIMVISIMPMQGHPPQIAEISIPRDWFVTIPLRNGKSTAQRINFAYAAGMLGEGPQPASAVDAGAAVADPLVAHLLGIGINYFVGVDFNAFKQAVDAVGGINVDVPAAFTDHQYPAGECDLGNCAYETVHFNAGMQHMNGATALIYARSRHGNNGQGSDFARSRRQQQIIVGAQGADREHRWLRQAAGCHQCARQQRAHRPDHRRRRVAVRVGQRCQPGEHRAHQHRRHQLPVRLRVSRRAAAAPTSTPTTRASRPSRISSRTSSRRPTALAEGAPVTFINASGRNNNATTRWASLMNMVGFSTESRRQSACTGGDPGHRQQWRKGRRHRAMARRLLRRDRHHRTRADSAGDDTAGDTGCRRGRRGDRHTRQRRRAVVPR